MHKNENQNIEFKEQWRDDILKTVCAFANTGGGVIYIGLDDKGRSVVLKDTKKLLEDIPNKIRDILGIVCDVKIIKKSGNPAIKIVTKKYMVIELTARKLWSHNLCKLSANGQRVDLPRSAY